MPAPSYTQTDYAERLQKHMPRGAAWPRDADSTQALVLQGLAGTFKDVNDDANGLLVDAFPETAVNLLSEWESTLGLTPSGTISQRQAAVTAALQAQGGASIPYFIALGASFGFTVTITVYRPTYVTDPVTRPLYGTDAAFRWTVTTTAAGSHTALEAAFREFAPAHTAVDFVYV